VGPGRGLSVLDVEDDPQLDQQGVGAEDIAAIAAQQENESFNDDLGHP
jgi:hypothetical protein